MGTDSRTPEDILTALRERIPPSKTFGGTDRAVLLTRIDILIRQTKLSKSLEIQSAIRENWRVVLKEAKGIPGFFDNLALTEEERAMFKKFIK